MARLFVHPYQDSAVVPREGVHASPLSLGGGLGVGGGRVGQGAVAAGCGKKTIIRTYVDLTLAN